MSSSNFHVNALLLLPYFIFEVFIVVKEEVGVEVGIGIEY